MTVTLKQEHSKLETEYMLEISQDLQYGWKELAILDKSGPVSFRIWLSDGRIWKHHIDHVRIRYPEDLIAPSVPEALVGPEQLMARETADTQTSQGQSSSELVPPVSNSSQSQQPRRSGRTCRPPEILC